MRNSGTTSKKGYFRAWLTTFWSYDFHSSSTKSAHIRFQAFHICFVLEAGHPSYGTIIQSDEISLHWLASDDTRCAFFFRNGDRTTYFHGVFSNNNINLYRTESTLCGVSKLHRFLLYRSNGEIMSCPDRCIPSAQARVGFQCIAGQAHVSYSLEWWSSLIFRDLSV